MKKTLDEPILFDRLAYAAKSYWNAWTWYVQDFSGRVLLHGRCYPTRRIAERAARNAGFAVGELDEWGEPV